MNNQIYTVLRVDNGKVSTFGPTGQVFTSFKRADQHAKVLRDRYTEQRFILCQAVAIYETARHASVESLVSGRSAKVARHASGHAGDPSLDPVREGRIVSLPSRRAAES